MRKSKFDLFIMQTDGGPIAVSWDYSTNGMAHWHHTDGKRGWWETGNKYVSEMRKKWKVIERIPESTWRACGAMKFLQTHLSRKDAQR